MADYIEFSYDEAKVNDIVKNLETISGYVKDNNISTLIEQLKKKTGWDRVPDISNNLSVIEKYKDKNYKTSIDNEKTRIADTLTELKKLESKATVTETTWWGEAGMWALNFTEGFLTGFEQIIDGLMTGAAVVCGWVGWTEWEQTLTDAVRYEFVASNFDWAFENIPFMAAIEKHASYNHDDPAADFMKGAGTVVAYVAIAALTGGTQGLSAAVADAAFTFVGELGAGTQDKLIADPTMSIQDAAGQSLGDAAFASVMAFGIGMGLEALGPVATKAIKGAGEKIAQRALKEAGEKALKEAAEQTLKAAGKEVTEQAIKETSDRNAKCSRPLLNS